MNRAKRGDREPASPVSTLHGGRCCTDRSSDLCSRAARCCACCGGGLPAGSGPRQRPLVVVVSGDTAGWIVAVRLRLEPVGRPAPPRHLRRRASPAGRGRRGRRRRRGARHVALRPGQVRSHSSRRGADGRCARTTSAPRRPASAPTSCAAWRRSSPCRWFRPTCATLPGDWWPSRCGSSPRRGGGWPWSACWPSVTRRPSSRCVRPARRCWSASAGAAGKFDAAIVLAYLPEDELRQLAEALPEADVVVGGPTGQPMGPKPMGPTLLSSATNKGKFLARLDAPAPGSADRWTGSIVELNGQFADDARAGRPTSATSARSWPAAISRRSRRPSPSRCRSNLPKEFAVAGTAACGSATRRTTGCGGNPHMPRAWKSLKETGAHVDPECQRCHTTGYGLPGGFASARRGAGRDRRGLRKLPRTLPGARRPSRPSAPPISPRPKNHCTACHDRENSPKFAYDKYWAKIAPRRASRRQRTPLAPTLSVRARITL